MPPFLPDADASVFDFYTLVFETVVEVSFVESPDPCWHVDRVRTF